MKNEKEMGYRSEILRTDRFAESKKNQVRQLKSV